MMWTRFDGHAPAPGQRGSPRIFTIDSSGTDGVLVLMSSNISQPSAALVRRGYTVRIGEPLDFRGQPITGPTPIQFQAAVDILGSFWSRGHFAGALVSAKVRFRVDEWDSAGHFHIHDLGAHTIIHQDIGWWHGFSDFNPPWRYRARGEWIQGMLTHIARPGSVYRVWVFLDAEIRAEGEGRPFSGSAASLGSSSGCAASG